MSQQLKGQSYRLFKLLKKEDGFALTAILVVFGVMTIIMTLAIVLLPLTQNETTATNRETAAAQSLYIAEAGLNDYVWHLNRLGIEYFSTTTHPAQGDGNWAPYEDGNYNLDITFDTDTASFEIIATGRVEINGIATTKKISAKVAAKSFTQYIWLTNHETVEGSSPVARIHFTSGDVIKGPLHSNDTINIMSSSSDPDKWATFEQHVSTSKPVGEGLYFKPGDENQVNFEDPESLEESAALIELPSTNGSIKEWANPAYNNGVDYQYTGATSIELNADGTMDINCIGSTNTGVEGHQNLPDSGVIYVDGVLGSKGNSENADVFVSGTLNGRLTIAARNNIYITGDLVYQDQDFDNPENDDMLGLVAENYIYILHFWSNVQSPPNGSAPFSPVWKWLGSKWGYDYTGVSDVAPDNITINAAMITLNHSYGFETHDVGEKEYIHFKGSIVQNFRGAIGTSGPTGYLKDYDYDPRMKYRQPPHYLAPANSGFEIVSWKETN